jgi:hypothetical protein
MSAAKGLGPAAAAQSDAATGSAFTPVDGTPHPSERIRSDVRAFLRALSTNLRCATHVRVNPEIRIAILCFSSDKFFQPERKLMFVSKRNNALLANATMRGDRSSEAQ